MGRVGPEEEVRNERSEERSFIEFSKRANCQSSLTSHFCTVRIRRFARDFAAFLGVFSALVVVAVVGIVVKTLFADRFHDEGLNFMALLPGVWSHAIGVSVCWS